jgi:signal peptidase
MMEFYNSSTFLLAGMLVTSALIIWKGLIVVTGSDSPVVVVLSGSMEPGFKRVSCLLTQIGNELSMFAVCIIFTHWMLCY